MTRRRTYSRPKIQQYIFASFSNLPCSILTSSKCRGMCFQSFSSLSCGLISVCTISSCERSCIAVAVRYRVQVNLTGIKEYIILLLLDEIYLYGGGGGGGGGVGGGGGT